MLCHGHVNPVVATVLQRPNGATRVDGHGRRHNSPREDRLLCQDSLTQRERCLAERCLAEIAYTQDRGFSLHRRAIGVQSGTLVGLGNTRHFTIVPAACAALILTGARDFDTPGYRQRLLSRSTADGVAVDRKRVREPRRGYFTEIDKRSRYISRRVESAK